MTIGKRPRTTLTPTLILKDGKAIVALNVAGGDLQDQSSLQMVINFIDFGMTAKECVGPPRFFTEHYVGSFNQPPPELGSLYMNKYIDPKIISDLKGRGHEVTLIDSPYSHDVILTVDPGSGFIRAAGDPRAERPFAGAF